MDEGVVGEFRDLLEATRRRIFENQVETMEHAQEAPRDIGDSLDHSTHEALESTEFRLRDREKKLVAKIDAALGRLESGEYWYCEGCGEEIGVKRLRARPVTNLCIDCKEEEEASEARIPKAGPEEFEQEF